MSGVRSTAATRSGASLLRRKPEQATHARRPRMSAVRSMARARSAGCLLRRSQNRQLMRGGRA